MPKQKYIEEVLTLPEKLPLFNYNINFDGLRSLLEQVNLKTNANEQGIAKLREAIDSKIPAAAIIANNKLLNGSFSIGLGSLKHLETKGSKSKDTQEQSKQLGDLQEFCSKLNKIGELIELLVVQTQAHEERIGRDSARNEQLIQESFRRLDDKIRSNLNSFSGTLNSYFSQSNEKATGMGADLTALKIMTENRMNELDNELHKRISEGTLRSSLEATQQRVKKALEAELKNDQMKRMATLNQYSNKLKELEKELDLKQKALGGKVHQLGEQVGKTLSNSIFQQEKHKIYDRLSEIKNRTDESLRRVNEFMEFRKGVLQAQEKTRNDFLVVNDELARINNKSGNMKKMEEIGDVLSSLDPHLICELGSEVKLHEKEIGKLEKQLLLLENEVKANHDSRQTSPCVQGGDRSELVQKIVRQFMGSMDFDGRMRRVEKENQELKRRNDGFNDLEKRVSSLSKEMDMGAVMKQLKKKCDQENTRKDVKILDGKIEQLFEFYKQTRREMEERNRRNSRQDPHEMVSLTTKKLVSTNCLSCIPSTPGSRRHYLRAKGDLSIDYGESQRSTLFARLQK